MSTEAALTRLELTWKARKGDIAPATMSAGMTLANLDRAGYVLGVGSTNSTAASYVHADPVKYTVSIHAWFIGPGAWEAAVAESASEDEQIFQIDTFCLTTTLPTVTDRTKGAHKPYPSFKKSLASKPTLRFCATDGSRCPPLLAADGGVIAQWKLGLSYKTRGRLAAWNQRARHVAGLLGAMGEPEPFRAWAKRELTSATGTLGKEAKALAGAITQECGAKVDWKGPYFNLMAP